jgi:glycosyltransferase involved in cell wall biosynthesis
VLRSGKSRALRVAIVHEWVDAYAGSEQVFEALAQEFPQADLYALTVTPGVSLNVGGREIETTWLNRPRLRDRRSLTLPLMPATWWAVGRLGYDLVISSSHAFAHANRLAREGGIHLSYVHSPARYLWSADIDQRGDAAVLRPAKNLLRAMDVRASRLVTSYAANSTAVATRISQFWGRQSTVIHPPVRVEYFHRHQEISRDYVLGVGRWIPYKNMDLVIRAGEIANMPVKIAGRGPDRDRLLALADSASVDVEIIESPDDSQLRELYAGARCLVFPTVEDFGIVPVEAQAAGTPIVSIRQGGVLDTVIDGVSGALVPTLQPHDLAAGISAAGGLDPEACVRSAERFSRGRFGKLIHAWVDAELKRSLS